MRPLECISFRVFSLFQVRVRLWLQQLERRAKQQNLTIIIKVNSSAFVPIASLDMIESNRFVAWTPREATLSPQSRENSIEETQSGGPNESLSSQSIATCVWCDLRESLGRNHKNSQTARVCHLSWCNWKDDDDDDVYCATAKPQINHHWRRRRRRRETRTKERLRLFHLKLTSFSLRCCPRRRSGRGAEENQRRLSTAQNLNQTQLPDSFYEWAKLETSYEWRRPFFSHFLGPQRETNWPFRWATTTLASNSRTDGPTHDDDIFLNNLPPLGARRPLLV